MFNVYSSNDFSRKLADITNTIRNGFPVFLSSDKSEDDMVVISMDQYKQFFDYINAKQEAM